MLFWAAYLDSENADDPLSWSGDSKKFCAGEGAPNISSLRIWSESGQNEVLKSVICDLRGYYPLIGRGGLGEVKSYHILFLGDIDSLGPP